ncbi:cat eye syndrome chromosome region, candidate 1 [Geranomyces variabilis]|uniref:adenosine deaminase n=1 Tax=Geranomyces variabilis TaxID=109894 RepID=A0AAD5TCB4_9FUNG|nr:cat eye syndrome chromosome region, candidate 1 [Geranomyces variabilis]
MSATVPAASRFRWAPFAAGLLVLVLAYYFSVKRRISNDEADVPDGAYLALRQALLELDNATRFDRNTLQWTALERKANAYLHKLRLHEGAALEAVSRFPPALRFPDAKSVIEGTRLFDAIRRMPKGGSLHYHLEALVDQKWLVAAAANESNCHVSFEAETYRTFANPPTASVKLPRFKFTSQSLPSTEWVTCRSARERHPGGPAAFDLYAESVNSVIPNAYATEDIAWARFGMVFNMLGDLLHYQPLFERYIAQALQTFYDDGVTYLEVRISKWPNYDEHGRVVAFSEVLDSVKRIVDAFRTTHPDFIDLRFIYQDVRFNTPEGIQASLDTVISLRKSHPLQIVGFDLVGHEKATPLIDLVPLLTAGTRAAKHAKVTLDYFLHAGETLHAGPAPPDANLVDALLLGTRRIGHGFSLSKHAGLMSKVIASDIAVEVAVISNQMLGLVGDIRRHPVIDMMLHGVQVVLASDDPSVFGYEGVSYDFYQVYMAFEALDLGSLKKLAMNGIAYSALGGAESKARAMGGFERRWAEWVQELAAH